MAAHVYTALVEIAASVHDMATHVNAALRGARWAHQLDPEDWAALDLAVFFMVDGQSGCRDAALALLPKYGQRWLDLGKPASYELWVDSVERCRRIADDLAQHACPNCQGLNVGWCMAESNGMTHAMMRVRYLCRDCNKHFWTPWEVPYNGKDEVDLNRPVQVDPLPGVPRR